MGTCYTYLLYDDFDWKYQNKTKQETIQAIKEEFPVAEILAQWSHYIVVDLDKNSPYKEQTKNLRKFCDSVYWYGDGDPYKIQKVDFHIDQKFLNSWNEEKYKPSAEETEAYRTAAEARVLQSLNDTSSPE